MKNFTCVNKALVVSSEGFQSRNKGLSHIRYKEQTDSFSRPVPRLPKIEPIPFYLTL